MPISEMDGRGRIERLSYKGPQLIGALLVFKQPGREYTVCLEDDATHDDLCNVIFGNGRISSWSP